MTRPVIVLLLGLAAGSARAQTPTCTYDTCALRLRETFFGGSSVVQGLQARRVARLGIFAPHVDVLASANDSAKAHYLAFRTQQNRGAGLLLVGLVSAGVVGALAYDEQHFQDNKGLVIGSAVVSVTFTIWGGAKQISARNHLQQSIWFYNRDLPR